MRESHIEIVLPGLVPRLRELVSHEPAMAEHLASYLARGTLTAHPSIGVVQSVLERCQVGFSAAGSLPPAIVGAKHDLGDAFSAPVLRADPVHLRADPSRVVLFDGHDLDISEDEASAFIEILNNNFAGDGMRFSRGANPARWYGFRRAALVLRTDQGPNNGTTV